MIFYAMLYYLDVPSSFDNPSSLHTYLLSSTDVVSFSDVPSLRYPLWPDSAGFEDSSCYDDILKAWIWIIIF